MSLNALSRKPETSALAAKRLLVGRGAPLAPEEGLAAIETLAAAGDADALATLATLRGAGAWTHHSWPEAMDLLTEAAELGSIEARTQLIILPPDRDLAAHVRAGDESSPARWRKLKDSIDLHAWVTPPPPAQVCDIPRVWVAEKFVTTAFCNWLVTRTYDRFKPALMRDNTTGVSRALDTRTCTDFMFDVLDGGIMMLLLRVKISNITSIPVPHMEPPQLFHYALGEEIKPHRDVLLDGERGYGEDGTYTGDRVATFLMYLNDGYDGGETEFPVAGFRFKGRAGDAMFFGNYRDKKPDPAALHSAAPVTRGEKFIFSQWIHNRPFQA